MSVPLVQQAIEILVRRKASASSVYVFPSRKSKTGHYETPTKAWTSLVSRAGLKEVRLHDLRRTLGSYMAINGCNIVAISKALGHKNQKTTEVYARLSMDPIRDGITSVDSL
jgi:integrase